MRFFLALIATVLVSAQVYAHDIYSNVKRGRDDMLCCGGEGPNADCEPLELDQIDISTPGNIRIYSKRYGAWVRVADKDIEWKLLPEDPLARPGHWCGKPHKHFKVPAMDPADPVYHTYCIFLAPPGF